MKDNLIKIIYFMDYGGFIIELSMVRKYIGFWLIL